MRKDVTEEDIARHVDENQAVRQSGNGQPARRGPAGSSSRFRGVTRHRRTKRWEAHIWDSKKQVYLGGFDREEHAAKAHDVMALKCRGRDFPINLKLVLYQHLLHLLPKLTRDDVVRMLRRQSKELSKAAPHPSARKGGRVPKAAKALAAPDPTTAAVMRRAASMEQHNATGALQVGPMERFASGMSADSHLSAGAAGAWGGNRPSTRPATTRRMDDSVVDEAFDRMMADGTGSEQSSDLLMPDAAALPQEGTPLSRFYPTTFTNFHAPLDHMAGYDGSHGSGSGGGAGQLPAASGGYLRGQPLWCGSGSGAALILQQQLLPSSPMATASARGLHRPFLDISDRMLPCASGPDRMMEMDFQLQQPQQPQQWHGYGLRHVRYRPSNPSSQSSQPARQPPAYRDEPPPAAAVGGWQYQPGGAGMYDQLHGACTGHIQTPFQHAAAAAAATVTDVSEGSRSLQGPVIGRSPSLSQSQLAAVSPRLTSAAPPAAPAAAAAAPPRLLRAQSFNTGSMRLLSSPAQGTPPDVAAARLMRSLSDSAAHVRSPRTTGMVRSAPSPTAETLALLTVQPPAVLVKPQTGGNGGVAGTALVAGAGGSGGKSGAAVATATPTDNPALRRSFSGRMGTARAISASTETQGFGLMFEGRSNAPAASEGAAAVHGTSALSEAVVAQQGLGLIFGGGSNGASASRSAAAVHGANALSDALLTQQGLGLMLDGGSRGASASGSAAAVHGASSTLCDSVFAQQGLGVRLDGGESASGNAPAVHGTSALSDSTFAQLMMSCGPHGTGRGDFDAYRAAQLAVHGSNVPGDAFDAQRAQDAAIQGVLMACLALHAQYGEDGHAGGCCIAEDSARPGNYVAEAGVHCVVASGGVLPGSRAAEKGGVLTGDCGTRHGGLGLGGSAVGGGGGGAQLRSCVGTAGDGGGGGGGAVHFSCYGLGSDVQAADSTLPAEPPQLAALGFDGTSLVNGACVTDMQPRQPRQLAPLEFDGTTTVNGACVTDMQAMLPTQPPQPPGCAALLDSPLLGSCLGGAAGPSQQLQPVHFLGQPLAGDAAATPTQYLSHMANAGSCGTAAMQGWDCQPGLLGQAGAQQTDGQAAAPCAASAMLGWDCQPARLGQAGAQQTDGQAEAYCVGRSCTEERAQWQQALDYYQKVLAAQAAEPMAVTMPPSPTTAPSGANQTHAAAPSGFNQASPTSAAAVFHQAFPAAAPGAGARGASDDDLLVAQCLRSPQAPAAAPRADPRDADSLLLDGICDDGLLGWGGAQWPVA